MKTSAFRPRQLLAVTAVVFLLGLVVAPAAHAQLGGVTDSVGDATGSVVDNVGGAVGDTVGETTGGVVDTVEGDGETSGSSTDPIGAVTDKVKDTVDKTANTVEETSGEVKDVADSTQETLNQTTAELGGNATGTVGKVAGQLVGSGGTKDNRTGGSRSPGGSTTLSPEVLGLNYEDALRAKSSGSARSATNLLISDPATSGDVAGSESIISQIGRVAAEVAQQVAFPLMLAMLVGGFLIVQNRIDRKDPKLAVAPVDSEHDLLNFS